MNNFSNPTKHINYYNIYQRSGMEAPATTTQKKDKKSSSINYLKCATDPATKTCIT